MLTRFWQWTNQAATPGAANAVTSIPIGPLRFRQWTDGTAVPGDADTGISFGPLRFRAWTNAGGVSPVDPGAGGGSPIRIPVDDRLRRLSLQRDDELLLIVAAAFVTLQ